ncbi:MAG: tetratricopeptide repeat protein [Acidobacteria bacterium]|nr:tetratricopeptide repeat protein [Acidobacteriota bacterium]
MERLVRAVVAVLVIMFSLPLMAADADDLFQQALVAERSMGDLPKAIALYGQVVEQAGRDRSLAVRALLKMGAAYEKLGQAEAKKAYERIVREYADQSSAVEAARERLARMTPPDVERVQVASVPAARMLWDEIPDGEGEVSADGRYFSYIAWETGDMAIRDLENGTNRLLTHSGPWGENDEFGGQSRFSPDGKWLAYTWYGSLCQPRCPVELRLVSTEKNEEPRVLIPAENHFYVEPGRFSPDGRRLLVSIERNENVHELGIVNLSDSSIDVLGRFESHPHPVEFSPDGRWVLYMNAPDGGAARGIFLQSVKGGDATLLAPGGFTEFAVGFCPRGDHVIFRSQRSGERALWQIGVRNGKPVGEPVILRSDFGADHLFGLTGDDLYYGTSTDLYDGYIVDLDDHGRPVGTPRRVTERVGQDQWPVWNGDGSKIAFVSRRSNASGTKAPRFVIRDLETGEERETGTDLRLIPGDPIAWSSDEKYFAVAARRGSSDVRLFVIDAETGESRQVGETESRGAAFSPDGTLLYYPQQGETGFKVVAHEIGSATDKVIYKSSLQPTTSFIGLSPDGRYMVVREQENDYRKEDLITITDLESGERRVLLREPVEIEGRNIAGYARMVFTPDGKYLIFGRWENGTMKNRNVQLWRVPLEGGPSELIGLSMPRLRGLQMHPNGRQIAFTSGASKGELWVLENFLNEGEQKTASR